MKKIIVNIVLIQLFGVCSLLGQNNNSPTENACSHIGSDSSYDYLYPKDVQFLDYTEGFINGGNLGNNASPPPPPPEVFSEYRVMTWVHGTNGSDNDWEVAAAEIENRYKSIALRPEYDQESWEIATEELDMNTRGNTFFQVTNHEDEGGIPDPLDPLTSFALSHSLGGLIARDVQRDFEINSVNDNENTFHGIVTFGTPHNGTPAADNIDLVGDWVYDGIIRFTNALLFETIQNTPAGLPVVEFVVELLTPFDYDVPLGSFDGQNLYVPEVWNTIWDKIEDQILPEIVKDMKPTSTRISSLQGYTNNKPSVAFYGTEEEPVFFRYLGTPSNSDSDPFENDEDDKFVEEVNNFILDLQESEESYMNAYLNYDDPSCDWWMWLHPLGCVGAEIFIFFSESWDDDDLFTAWKFFEKAGFWLENANDSWKIFLGAAQIKDTMLGYICRCGDSVDITAIDNITIVDSPLDCSGDLCILGEELTVLEYEEIDESDGLIIASSARGFPNVGAEDRMHDTNHNQMKNNSELGDKLRILFETNLYGEWFNTPQK